MFRQIAKSLNERLAKVESKFNTTCFSCNKFTCEVSKKSCKNCKRTYCIPCVRKHLKHCKICSN